MLIGLSGKIGSGKDTFAGMLKTCWPLFETKSFAYKLKHIVAYLTGEDEELMFTQEGKNKYLPEWEMTIGEFQQKLGTEGLRQGVHSEGWILALFADYTPNKDWVITDARFKNEAKAVQDRDGYLVRIEGDPAEIRKNSLRDMSHPSEIDLDDWPVWDFIIQNNGTLSELRTKAREVYTSLRHHNLL